MFPVKLCRNTHFISYRPSIFLISIDLRILVLRLSEIRRLWSTRSFTYLALLQVQIVWPVTCFVSFRAVPCWHSLITKTYNYLCTAVWFARLDDSWLSLTCLSSAVHRCQRSCRILTALAVEWSKWDRPNRPAAANADWRKAFVAWKMRDTTICFLILIVFFLFVVSLIHSFLLSHFCSLFLSFLSSIQSFNIPFSLSFVVYLYKYPSY